MRRGFKTWSEEQATAFRLELDIRPDAPLPAERLADHLGIRLMTPAEVPGMTSELLDTLLTKDTSGWSAVTVQADDLTVVVYNISHSIARRESDLMHEIAHIVCKHPAMRLIKMGGMALREYSEVQEEEAAWLGACLHLPRVALCNALRRGLTVPSIMERFNASEQMVRYRRNVTGVDVQIARARY
jgi:Zn-dependent peptidase ImmA (M78 family)